MATKVYTQDNRPLAVSTPLGKDALLLEKFSGSEAISTLFRFDLQMLVEGKESIAFDKLLGQNVSVVVRPPTLVPRYYHGIVSRLCEGVRTIGSNGTSFIRYRAEIVPKPWLLTRGAQSRIFQQMTVPDILKEVFADFTVTWDIQGTFEKRDYCTQYRESDFDFASRLMEEEGIFYFFKHEESSHTMVVANTAQSYVKTAGPETISYDELFRGPRDAERISNWSKSQEIRAAKGTLWDYSFEMPDKNMESKENILESIALGTVTHKLKIGANEALEIYDFPGAFTQRFDGIDSAGTAQASELEKAFSDGTRTVGIRMEEQAAVGFAIDASSDCRLLTPGYKFTLDQHYNANGDYVLLSIQHESSIAGAYTEDQPRALLYRNSFQCLPAALAFRPPRKTPRPRIDGTQTGLVVGPSGDEISTDKYGRIKVQFRWDREGKKDQASSCWLRVGTPWAGQQWGMIHIPRIGQEVIIAFEEGDPDQPIAIGSVYNADMMPPYVLPDNKTQSGVKSRSTLKGETDNFNELRFEDKKDAEEIYFHAEKDFNRVVENNDTLKVGFIKKDKGDQTIEIQNNQTLTVGNSESDDGSQTITIWKNRTETIKEGDETITIEKGKRTETITKGDEAVTLEAGSRTHKIKKDDSLTIEGKQTIEVTDDRTITVKQGNETIEISTGNRSVTIKTGNDTTKVSAGKSSTEAMQSIELKVGGNSIKIDQSGVTITGIAVKVVGSASADVQSPVTTVKADGMLTLKGGITMIN